VRRGAADRRRSDGTVAWCWVAVSRAGGGLTAEPSWLPSAACAACHRNAVRRPAGRRLVVGLDVGVPAVAWSPCPHPRSASTRPVSGVHACDVRASGVRCPGVSGVGVRVSIVRGVQRRCPRVPRAVRVRCVRIGDLVEHVGASDSHTARGPGAGRPAVPANGSGNLSEPAPGRCAGAGRAGPAATSGRTWSSSWRRSGSGPGSIAWPARDTPVEQDRPSVWEQVCALCTQAVAWRRAGRQGRVGGMRPTMTWAGRRRRPGVSSGW
jgi:hypothetical protein